ncbi:cupin domain-containing protein [Nonomuraea basaltis]|uniref:cupin domain-containing protein n=1 Tax=Nonomuraea basaltis TaxID=2495887 RepID=UPI0023F50A27|nr:cupin domain-containing protein [Nonomuraea basaltis]
MTAPPWARSATATGPAGTRPGGRACSPEPITHRRSGPAFGFVLEGEMLLELEGEPERVVRAGEAFWEAGGDVIHYQDGNNRDDIPLRFTVTMLCEPGKPMFTLVDEDELAQRKDRRAPRPA